MQIMSCEEQGDITVLQALGVRRLSTPAAWCSETSWSPAMFVLGCGWSGSCGALLYWRKRLGPRESQTRTCWRDFWSLERLRGCREKAKRTAEAQESV